MRENVSHLNRLQQPTKYRNNLMDIEEQLYTKELHAENKHLFFF